MMMWKWSVRLAMGCLGAIGLVAATVTAAFGDTSWRLGPPTTGAWLGPENWTNGVPNGAENAYLDNGGTALVSAGGTAKGLFVGCSDGGSGTVQQTGGYLTIVDPWPSGLYLGDSANSTGTYILSGGQLSSKQVNVGNYGTGYFTQTGGTCDTGYEGFVAVGREDGSEGTYLLEDGGELVTKSIDVGLRGTGLFRQTGGTHRPEYFAVAWGPGSVGLYHLESGQLLATANYISGVGQQGAGAFRQTGGHATIHALRLYGKEATATYELSGDASLSSTHQEVGYQYSASVTQSGGTNSVSYRLVLGLRGGDGTYTLTDGRLTAAGEDVGGSGPGFFNHIGGVNQVEALVIGSSSLAGGSRRTAEGTYTLAGGVLDVGAFEIGKEDSGLLAITSAAAEVTISDLLRFGPYGTLTTVPGAAIHMTGSAFENELRDEAALAGLENLELIFDGGSADTCLFEVAGLDLGPAPEGFDLNYSLAAITLGGTDAALVQLVDAYNNANRGWPGGPWEALYVHDVTVGPGSVLDLNGFHVYYDGTFVNEGTVLNGEPVYVPEPATLGLLAVAVMVRLGRRRGRQGRG